jgi:nucleoside-diphosphate kinase
MEKTLLIIKPTGLRKKAVGFIISRLEASRINILAIKMTRLTPDLARGFYAEHEGKPFFPGLLEYMTSGPVIPMVLAGDSIIQKIRSLVGATNPAEAIPGTIRYDYADSVRENAVHASDSPRSAEREIAFFFKPEEIINQ